MADLTPPVGNPPDPGGTRRLLLHLREGQDHGEPPLLRLDDSPQADRRGSLASRGSEPGQRPAASAVVLSPNLAHRFSSSSTAPPVAVTAQGPSRAIFSRAIEHGNPMTWRMPPVRTAVGAGLAEEVGADRRVIASGHRCDTSAAATLVNRDHIIDAWKLPSRTVVHACGARPAIEP